MGARFSSAVERGDWRLLRLATITSDVWMRCPLCRAASDVWLRRYTRYCGNGSI